MGEVLQFPGHGPRLRALSQRERDTKEAHTAALRARNEAIVEADDDDYAQFRIARDCELSTSSITRVLGQPYGQSAA